MGFDFFSRIDCAIQKPRDDQEFVQRAKVGVYAAQMTGEVEREEDPVQRAKIQESITFPFPVKTLMGARAQLSYRELTETWERIERKSRPVCRDCPVNLGGGALGCWGTINYPISQAAERWLIDRLNPPAPGPSYLVHHITQAAKLDGKRLDRDRAETQVGPENARISILLPPGPAEKWVEGERITSSMVIEYLLACQPLLLPVTLMGILEDLGAIEVDGMTKMLLRFSLMTNSETEKSETLLSQIRFNLPDAPGDDRSIIQFKRFLKSCYLALIHRGRMKIDG